MKPPTPETQCAECVFQKQYPIYLEIRYLLVHSNYVRKYNTVALPVGS